MNDLLNKDYGLELSKLPKTWIFDIDGTIVKHNGYLIDGHDILLPGVKNFFSNIPDNDVIILLTSRKSEYLEDLRNFLRSEEIKFDYIITDLPQGERIMVNDNKPSGLKCAYAINKERDKGLNINYQLTDK